MTYVHVRESERLCSYGDHRLEPPGSRAYPNSGILGNLTAENEKRYKNCAQKETKGHNAYKTQQRFKKNCSPYSEQHGTQSR